MFKFVLFSFILFFMCFPIIVDIVIVVVDDDEEDDFIINVKSLSPRFIPPSYANIQTYIVKFKCHK
uniref:Uncharacterized protein n=1 Tax=Cannabis sativa TaxID=3483 RepID=A0A803QUZ6_CANSA